MMSVWDYCNIDPSLVEEFDVLQEELFVFKAADSLSQPSGTSSATTNNTAPSSSSVANKSSTNYTSTSSGVDNQVQSILFDTNESCRQSLESLDSVLLMIQDVKSAFFDVTGRTNSLIQKCETLLDQQHTLQNTVEILHKTIQPFDEIESVAQLLGIPFDMPTTTLLNKHSPQEVVATTLDPRSPEFQDILTKLSNAVVFLQQHQEILEHERYSQWLDKLQIRATSLIGRAMRDLLDKAGKQCREMIQQKVYHHQHSTSASTNNTATGANNTATSHQTTVSKVLVYEDQPLESSFIYQKFRTLAYRMKELANVLMRGGSGSGSSTGNTPHGNGATSSPTPSKASLNLSNHDMIVLQEVKKQYGMIRMELLVPFLREAWTVAIASAAATNSNNGNAGSANTTASLSSTLRQAFSVLLRVTQLEVQLFESLFGTYTSSTNTAIEGRGGGGSTPASTTGSSASSTQHQDMLRIIESIANTTRDFLRPHIIRESNVDELCRVISALTEDMRSQITILSIATTLSKQLISGLDGTINDAKERLIYCAETKLRQDIQLFEPLPSQLAYPDILEQYEETRKQNQKNAQQADVYNTWYPPMRQCLSLLSKLYGVIDVLIFEDFARRGIESTIQSLLHASDAIRRTRQHIHSDLFLIRHLLILREQLIPFEMKLSAVERHMDFTTTTQAWTNMILASSSRALGNGTAAAGANGAGGDGQRLPDASMTAKALANLLRLDTNNFFIQFATQGLPMMQELTIDTKRDLDVTLKKACIALKSTALKLMIGPIDGLLAKVTAFIGEIPYQASLKSTPSQDDADDNKASASYQKSKVLASASNQLVLLSNETKQTLKNQSFLRAERMKECLEQVQQLLIQRIPDIKEMMHLYIDNMAARNVLIKSIVQEFDVSKKKLECVMYSCVDAGQALRDLEHLVHHVSFTITSELAPSPSTAVSY